MPAKTKLPKSTFVMCSYLVYAGDDSSSVGGCKTCNEEKKEPIRLYTSLAVWMGAE